jgi:mono/diheme cytochrome c family protein
MSQQSLFPSLRRAIGAGIALAALTAGLAAAAPAVGARAGEFAFKDLSGKRHTSAGLQSAPATVFLFLSTECPISQRYAPRIVSLAGQYGPQGVQFVGIHPNAQETPETVASDAKERGFTFPVAKDAGSLASALGARMTPEAVVLDRDGVIRYRGRIDDNKDVTRVKSHDLSNALDALLAGRPVPRAEAPAFGCAIRRATPATKVAKGAASFTRDVAPILQRHCQGCHRPGDVAPFSLLTYEQAAAWASDVKRVATARTMPPWKAAHGHGDFVNERRLSDAEIATIARWAEGGAPKGEAKHMPPPARFPQGWGLGQPDLVLEPEEAYELAAEGKDVYRHFVLPKVFEEETWVTAMEVAAQNRSIVHHVIAYIDPQGKSLALDAADPGPGYSNSGGGPGFFPMIWLGGWAPGNTARFAPPGTAVRIPKGSRIVLQVHYHKNGKPEKDRTRIGLHFAKSPVEKRIRVAPVLNLGFELPPGAERHEVTARMVIPRDVHLHSIIPHMHLLGRDIKLTATLPDGTVKPLVWVPDWDFNWQETYAYREPLALPKGTRVKLTAYYDNSEKNPHNPHKPPKTVRWGEETTDEMCIAFLAYTVDDENLTSSAKAASSAPEDNIEVQ